ncbi:YcaO-like family protein, partial [Planctomycetota bacterium]
STPAMLLKVKDRAPEETIAAIRGIAQELGILHTERWYSYKDKVFSVALDDAKAVSSEVAIGKGTTKLGALASAYGEFIERMQHGYFVSPRFGLMKDKRSFDFGDDELIPVDDFDDEQRAIFRGFFDDSFDQLRWKERRINCVPFYDVLEDRLAYLPGAFMKRSCLTNGVAAGNTSEECLVEAISEIFERHVVSRTFIDKLDLPTIPLSEARVHPDSREIIAELQREGHRVLIKDATLGGRYPVVCVVAVDRRQSNFTAKFGAHPLFEVALERCLTEVFQQRTRLPITSSITPRVGDEAAHSHNRTRYIHSGAGTLPANLLFNRNGSRPKHREAFQESFSDNRSALGFLMQSVRNNGHRIYVRDTSFLGFPSYQAYIPGITELHKLSAGWVQFLNHSDRIRETLLHLNTAAAEDIEKALSTLEDLYWRQDDASDRIRHSQPVIFLCGIFQKPDGIWREFRNVEYLFACLFCRLGNFEKAFKYLDNLIEKRSGQIENLSEMKAIRTFLYLRSQGFPEGEIEETMKELYGRDMAEPIIEDLSDHTKVLDSLCLPECGDCGTCPAADVCLYEEWQRRSALLEEKIGSSVLDQRKVAQVFRGL